MGRGGGVITAKSVQSGCLIKKYIYNSSRAELIRSCVKVEMTVEVLLYVHRNRRLIRNGSPGQPPRLSHSS